METTHATPTLSDLLGIDIVPAGQGLKELRAFHEKYPDETKLDSAQPVVTFQNEDIFFELRSDTSREDLGPVFKIVALTHCPTETKFDSGWVDSVDEAMETLIDAFEDGDGDEDDEDGEDEDGDEDGEDGDGDEDGEDGDGDEDGEDGDGDEDGEDGDGSEDEDEDGSEDEDAKEENASDGGDESEPEFIPMKTLPGK